jgi:hypothetical protein
MGDQAAADHRLSAILDEVIGAIQDTKQAVWSAPSDARRHELEQLRQYLVAQADLLVQAEDAIDGRDPHLSSPTGHRLRNLRMEAGGDADVMLSLLLDELAAVTADAREGAAPLEPSEYKSLLESTADGLTTHVIKLRPRSK